MEDMQKKLHILGLTAERTAATELKFVLHRRVLLYHTFKLSQLFPFLVAYARSKRRLCPEKVAVAMATRIVTRFMCEKYG